MKECCVTEEKRKKKKEREQTVSRALLSSAIDNLFLLGLSAHPVYRPKIRMKKKTLYILHPSNLFPTPSRYATVKGGMFVF